MLFLSLFSGIEAASVAWLPLEWECAAVAEIDKFPCAVLAHHYPNVPNLGNVSNILREHLAAIGPVDAVVFGFPCQDLSVAGKRAGLKGERSGLFFEAMRIVELCRELWGTRWTIAENVPGLFSSNSGLDFAAVVGELAGAELPVPKNKWQNTGVALGPRGLVEWAVLDAQWFGVPQRRRRVFLVRDSGDWRSRPPILFERQSLQGNSPPSREKRESAPTIPSRRSAGGGLGTDFDCDGGLVESRITSLVREREGSHPLTCHQVKMGDPTTDNYIVTGGFFDRPTRSQSADGFDASEDGPGRRTPLVPIAIQERAICENADAGPDGIGVREDGVAYTLEGRAVPQAVGYMSARTFGKDGGIDSRYAPRNICDALHTASGGGNKAPLILQKERVGTSSCLGCLIEFSVHYLPGTEILEPFVCPQCGDCPGYMTYDVQHGGTAPIAFSCKDSGLDSGDISPTLRGMGHSESHANAEGQAAVAVGFQSSQSGIREVDTHATLDSNNGSRRHNGVVQSMQVRRLTPTECERLQDFPDDYTKINDKTADGPRYKALGNSMAVCCMEYIGRRIQLINLFS